MREASAARVRARAAVAKRLERTNRGAAARLALVGLLCKVGESVTLVEVHTWPRHVQGRAYLWAIDRLAGVENVPRPWGFPLGFQVVLRVKTKPPENGGIGMTRGGLMGRMARAKKQREQACLEVKATLHSRRVRPVELLPVRVTMTRVSAGHLDGDNLRGALKHVRDGIADALGFKNDDHPHLRFEYAQRRGPQKTYLVEVLVERAA